MIEKSDFLSQRLRAIFILFIACFSVFAISEANDRMNEFKAAQKYKSAKVFLEKIEIMEYGRTQYQRIAIFRIYDPLTNTKATIKKLRPTDLFFERAIFDKNKYRANSTINVLANSARTHYYLEIGNTKNLWAIIAIGSIFWLLVMARLAYALIKRGKH